MGWAPPTNGCSSSWLVASESGISSSLHAWLLCLQGRGSTLLGGATVHHRAPGLPVFRQRFISQQLLSLCNSPPRLPDAPLFREWMRKQSPPISPGCQLDNSFKQILFETQLRQPTGSLWQWPFVRAAACLKNHDGQERVQRSSLGNTLPRAPAESHQKAVGQVEYSEPFPVTHGVINSFLHQAA